MSGKEVLHLSGAIVAMLVAATDLHRLGGAFSLGFVSWSAIALINLFYFIALRRARRAGW